MRRARSLLLGPLRELHGKFFDHGILLIWKGAGVSWLASYEMDSGQRFLFWKKDFGDEGYSFESGDVVALLLTGIYSKAVGMTFGSEKYEEL